MKLELGLISDNNPRKQTNNQCNTDSVRTTPVQRLEHIIPSETLFSFSESGMQYISGKSGKTAEISKAGIAGCTDPFQNGLIFLCFFCHSSVYILTVLHCIQITAALSCFFFSEPAMTVSKETSRSS